MHTFGNKGSPSNFGKNCDYTSLYLQPLEYELIFSLPIFFSASNERNESSFMFTMFEYDSIQPLYSQTSVDFHDSFILYYHLFLALFWGFFPVYDGRK